MGDQGIDQRASINYLCHGTIVSTLGGDACDVLGGKVRQRIAKWRAWIDERASGKLQTHGFDHDLVTICCALKSTGAWRVIRLAFRFEQFIAANFALSKQLSDPNFFFVR